MPPGSGREPTINANEAWAERKSLGYKTLSEREMENPEFSAGVEAEMAQIARESGARGFARLVATEMLDIQLRQRIDHSIGIKIKRLVPDFVLAIFGKGRAR